MTEPICSPASLEAKLTLSPGTGLPFASVTVAVMVDVELPFATIEPGESPTLTLAAGPTVCVSDAVPDTDPSAAVIVGVPTLVDDVIVAVYVPSP